MRKIIELDVILPYYEAKYKVGEKIKDTITITFTDIESFKITKS